MNIFWFSQMLVFLYKIFSGELEEVDDIREFDVVEKLERFVIGMFRPSFRLTFSNTFIFSNLSIYLTDENIPFFPIYRSSERSSKDKKVD